MNKAFGRLPARDGRDLAFPAAPILQAQPQRSFNDFQYWWPTGWWGNQGYTPQCVAYAWLHFIEDGPITFAPRAPGANPVENPKELYDECQLHDEWPGQDYDGTSVRAGAKVLQRSGYIEEYRWAFDIEQVVQAVMTVCPVVVGTWWYSGMSQPDPDGWIKVKGSRVGSHAYVINGANSKEGFLRVKNSWGRDWGKDGYAYISFEDMARLINEDGEACVAIESVEPE